MEKKGIDKVNKDFRGFNVIWKVNKDLTFCLPPVNNYLLDFQ
jgi:hypothetical protein